MSDTLSLDPVASYSVGRLYDLKSDPQYDNGLAANSAARFRDALAGADVPPLILAALPSPGNTAVQQLSAPAPTNSAIGPAATAVGTGQPSATSNANAPANTEASPAPSQEQQLTDFMRYLADPTREGQRLDVYPDSRRIPTVGVGHKVLPEDNLQVGQTITQEQSDAFLRRDAQSALDAARQQMSQAGITDPAFLNALGSVNFQLGTNWNQPPNGFTQTWGDITRGDYSQAATDAGQSRWATQTPVRVQQFQDALHALPTRQ